MGSLGNSQGRQWVTLNSCFGPQTGWSSKVQSALYLKETHWFYAARPGKTGHWPKWPSTEMAQQWVLLDPRGNSPLPWYERLTVGTTTAVASSEALVLGAQKQHLLWPSRSKVRAEGNVIMARGGGETQRDQDCHWRWQDHWRLRNRFLANAQVGFQERQHLSITFSRYSALSKPSVFPTALSYRSVLPSVHWWGIWTIVRFVHLWVFPNLV